MHGTGALDRLAGSTALANAPALDTPPQLSAPPPRRPAAAICLVLAFLCCSCSLQDSLAGLSSQSPAPPAAAPLPSAVTCTRAAVWCQTGRGRSRQGFSAPAARQAAQQGMRDDKSRGWLAGTVGRRKASGSGGAMLCRVPRQHTLTCHPYPSPLERRPAPTAAHLDLLWSAAHDNDLGAALQAGGLQMTGGVGVGWGLGRREGGRGTFILLRACA